MDGVIADTGAYHCKSWQYVFHKRNIDFTEEDFRRIFGQRNDTIIRGVLGQDLSQEEVDAIAAEKEEYFRELVARDVKAFPGALELIQDLVAQGFLIAVASSAPPENIKLILEKLGVKDLFHAIVYGREVTEGKPSPQVYLLAAKKLNIEPESCIVIEDAVAGVCGAKRAGMLCVAVTNTHTAEHLAEADLVESTLENVKASRLEKAIKERKQKT